MALRRALKLPPFGVSRYRDASAKGRRTLAAFLLGATISVAGLAAFVGSGAAARGPFMAYRQPTYSFVRVGPSSNAFAREYYAQYYDSLYRDDERFMRLASRSYLREWGSEDGEPRRHKHAHAHVSRAQPAAAHFNSFAREPVCVRLCDGFFFPTPTAASDENSQTAACNSLCPDAPTQVFYKNGSDRIEDAISAKGQPYTALPVSLRYRTTADSTCSCHRDAVAYAPLSDATLRHGDAVMTPAGFMVFGGASGPARGAGDFVALTKAAIPASQRGALQSLERVSVSNGHPSLKDWLVSQSAIPVAKAGKPLEKHAENIADRIRLLVWPGAAGVD